MTCRWCGTGLRPGHVTTDAGYHVEVCTECDRINDPSLMYVTFDNKPLVLIQGPKLLHDVETGDSYAVTIQKALTKTSKRRR